MYVSNYPGMDPEPDKKTSVGQTAKFRLPNLEVYGLDKNVSGISVGFLTWIIVLWLFKMLILGDSR